LGCLQCSSPVVKPEAVLLRCRFLAGNSNPQVKGCCYAVGVVHMGCFSGTQFKDCC
jgi:hypothetical protein